ncbi:hypothetical protein [Undibacterium sp. Ren11W]|uniref:hypothetical protein n=1 Tax=Undibacterium sp. Ren11W TaxID=3413045 RepID=UPI003BF05E2C
MKKIILFVGFCIASLGLATSSFAKLAAPSEEAKLKAAETKAKTAWSDKVSAYQLCKAQDKVAAGYLKAKGSAAPTPLAMPACADPGPYVAAPTVPALVAAATPASAAMVTASPAANSLKK